MFIETLKKNLKSVITSKGCWSIYIVSAVTGVLFFNKGIADLLVLFSIALVFPVLFFSFISLLELVAADGR